MCCRHYCNRGLTVELSLRSFKQGQCGVQCLSPGATVVPAVFGRPVYTPLSYNHHRDALQYARSFSHSLRFRRYSRYMVPPCPRLRVLPRPFPFSVSLRRCLGRPTKVLAPAFSTSRSTPSARLPRAQHPSSAPAWQPAIKPKQVLNAGIV